MWSHVWKVAGTPLTNFLRTLVCWSSFYPVCFSSLELFCKECILREEVCTKLIFNSPDKGNKFVMTNMDCGRKGCGDRSINSDFNWIFIKFTLQFEIGFMQQWVKKKNPQIVCDISTSFLMDARSVISAQHLPWAPDLCVRLSVNRPSLMLHQHPGLAEFGGVVILPSHPGMAFLPTTPSQKCFSPLQAESFYYVLFSWLLLLLYDLKHYVPNFWSVDFFRSHAIT